MKPTVQVLLSTYNGEKYIAEQINSILKQIEVEVHLLIRDDGSNDNTCAIMETYKSKQVQILRCKNVGSTNSFFDLLQKAGIYDYYAFADQDDVWDDDKLITAINSIKNMSKPAIYSSNTRLVDEDLNPLSYIERKAKTNLGSAIVKNYVAGCTAVFNYQLLKELQLYTPNDIPFHDWWVNLVALSLGGSSIYDSTPHMSYRQHGNNVVGASDRIIDKWKVRFNKFIRVKYKRNNMAQQLLTAYDGKIVGQERILLEQMADYKNNKKRLFSSDYSTGCKLDDFVFKICVLFDKI